MTGAATFLRMFLRRDRWMLLAWALGAVLLYWSQAYSVDGLYSSQAEFDRAAASMGGNAAFIAMAGPPRALNTLGGQVTWQAAAFGAVLAGLMSMFIVARHTRAEEESGRDELVRGTAVGRHAPMTAALVTALLANVVLGVLVAVSLWAYPLAAADSWALGLGLVAVGWCFTGTALVAAQVASTTRGAYGLAGAVLGLAYALRAVGDVGNHALSWLSPIGWYQAMHAFSGLRWWPVALLLLGAAVTTAAAYALFGRRDLGGGVLAARPGPGRARPRLGGALGLAWRLQRGAVLGWGLGVTFTAVAYGAIGDDVGTLMGDSKASRQMFAAASGDIVDAFYATAGLMLALLACGFAISSALRPRGEEDEGRVEALMATALPRLLWLRGHNAVTAIGAVVVLVGAGAGLGGGFALATGDGGALLRLGLPVLQYLPAVLLLAAVAVLLYAVQPRLAVLAWLPLVVAVVVMFFGDLLRLPQWFQDLSPFEHLALVPAQEMRWTPFVVLWLLAAAVWTAAQLAFRRRDLR